jgi:hypothetical protein
MGVYPLRGNLVPAGSKLTDNDETRPRIGHFGYSVALSADGNTALISGPNDNLDTGAAWVFTRSDATWTQHGPKLTANDESAYGFFGDSVSLSADGSIALIGGGRDNLGAGAAWVFSLPLLVGSSQVEPSIDSNPAGTAEAFLYTAVGTGSVGEVSAYLDGMSSATSVTVGLYTNTSGGNPGVLLTSGTMTSPQAGAWNTVRVSAIDVTAGTDY